MPPYPRTPPAVTPPYRWGQGLVGGGPGKLVDRIKNVKTHSEPGLRTPITRKGGLP